MAEIGNNLHLAAQLLGEGALVAIPTETVYGLAANALNEKAVLSIFAAKQRPSFDPLIVHLANINEVEKYAYWHHPLLTLLAQTFWPGPLTILLPKKSLIPDIVCSGLPQVALRVPKHPLCLALLNELSFPLAAPSANPFGYISPTNASHVNRQLGTQISYIVDGGQCDVGLESTIVGCEGDDVVVYRLGGLSLQSIEKVVGNVKLAINQSSNPLAPGQLKSHYAPKKTLVIGDLNNNLKKFEGKKIALLCFGKTYHSDDVVLSLNLSTEANLDEAALNLFGMMRLADESNAEIILTELLPQHGLGLAINDRLMRASK